MKKTQHLAKIAVNKSLLKEYTSDRIVYLEDGQEFQIQLFNPYTYTVGVAIRLNGDSDNNYLVLRPGERVWLERHLDNSKKFKFSTYFVEDSKEAKEATTYNGSVIVSFYKERKREIFRPTVSCSPKNWWDNVDINSTPLTFAGSTPVEDYATRILYSGTNDKLNVNPSSAVNGIRGIDASTRYCQTTMNCDNDINTSPQIYEYSTLASSSIETGRIEEGSHSNQQFESVDKDFELLPFYSESIKLMPKSRKAITSDDLNKRYCHQCGRKLSQKYKFCPFCGAKQ